MFGGNLSLRDPDFESLVIRWVDRCAQPVDRHGETLGDQIPRERDGGFLEVVAGRREVAEHLEKGVVPVGLAHLFDVSCPQAFLGRGDSGRGRLTQAQVVGLKWLHSGRDEERARVAMRHKRRAGQDQMLPAREML